MGLFIITIIWPFSKLFGQKQNSAIKATKNSNLYSEKTSIWLEQKHALNISKCDNQKLLKVYRYREKSIDIARKFDTISNPDIVPNQFRFDFGASIFVSKYIVTSIFLSKFIDRNTISIKIYRSKQYFYQNVWIEIPKSIDVFR